MKGQTNQSILRPKLQRRLRNNMTDAEQRLWRFLRRKQVSGFKFRRQHPFGDYIIDFVCLEAMLAVEVDGGQHHARLAEDTPRTEYLKRAGFHVLRFWNNEVMTEIDSVTAGIWRALQTLDPPPSQPSPRRGRSYLDNFIAPCNSSN
ncbi:MAG TPA: endonuclease domain-containing protein [Burkholderiales bacterium]|nr:endonuclease domain-containing protein [Burkholderiales bacterium]